ncbi:Spx/MgsR family RNA polymerase-binding regulatory protein [Pontibacillus yanchengensis]|uniref:Spx/MgsR family RNA polymerase-binding regulatory protein n=2 Tax=Pontibacillus yanchengensis TaxID=462910 RepID=A0ACC7VH58_9BACI|nr:Spx/MgsR family RNA polymerase-binding regulatory protein [Pontibacillus yanchengensis]MYL33486.1 Spx/MgsR family RNA polymerase-binding regulatory protein [Pontibacillus yanchengensis]MYL53536.1 Spx/MgsR family RNA polymerase-binding regulatory protein [Pontibacillus yanchengensis]
MSELKFYTYPSCTSCRRTKAWLKNQEVTFKERHIFRETPTYDELLEILQLTTNGIDEILATRGKTYKSLDVDVDNLSISEFIELVMNEPKLLRRPIVTDGEKLVVGYNEDGLKSIAKVKQDFLLSNIS